MSDVWTLLGYAVSTVFILIILAVLYKLLQKMRLLFSQLDRGDIFSTIVRIIDFFTVDVMMAVAVTLPLFLLILSIFQGNPENLFDNFFDFAFSILAVILAASGLRIWARALKRGLEVVS